MHNYLPHVTLLAVGFIGMSLDTKIDFRTLSDTCVKWVMRYPSLKFVHVSHFKVSFLIGFSIPWCSFLYEMIAICSGNDFSGFRMPISFLNYLQLRMAESEPMRSLLHVCICRSLWSQHMKECPRSFMEQN